MGLPNFLIIGAGKAGSTSLWRYVSQHPDVFPTKIKEPSYFWTYRHTRRGTTATLEEYERLFENSENYSAVGEASPGYLSDENAPQRIAELIPDVRLIAIVRDPSMRAFSEYTMQRMRGDEPMASFLDAIAAEELRPLEHQFRYVENGLYFRNLKRYLRHFPKSQLKVVFNEDLRSHPDEVVADVFRFLEIDRSTTVDTSADFTISGMPRSRFVHRVLGTNTAVKRAATQVAPKAVRERLREVRDNNLERQHMTSKERASMVPRFVDDIRSLEVLLERDLAAWRAR